MMAASTIIFSSFGCFLFLLSVALDWLSVCKVCHSPGSSVNFKTYLCHALPLPVLHALVQLPLFVSHQHFVHVLFLVCLKLSSNSLRFLARPVYFLFERLVIHTCRLSCQLCASKRRGIVGSFLLTEGAQMRWKHLPWSVCFF